MGVRVSCHRPTFDGRIVYHGLGHLPLKQENGVRIPMWLPSFFDIWSRRLVVRTLDFQSNNGGSIPLATTKFFECLGVVVIGCRMDLP